MASSAHTDTSKYFNRYNTEYYDKVWGGYVKKPTSAEIQADLDAMRDD